MTHTFETEMPFGFGPGYVYLRVRFNFVKGAGPRFSLIDGGEPGYGPEVDICRIWMHSGDEKWREIHDDFICDQIHDDNSLYEMICDYMTEEAA